MFRAVYSNQIAGVPVGADMATMMQPVNQLSGNNAVMQGFPVTLQDGRTVMYCVPASGSPATTTIGASHPQQQQQQSQQTHFIPFPAAPTGQAWPQASTQDSLSLSQLSADNAASQMWFAANQNGTASGAPASATAAGPLNSAPILMQAPLLMPSFAVDKHPSSVLSYTTNGLSSPGRGVGATAGTNATSNFNASATSIASSSALAAGAAGGNIAMGHLSPASGNPGFQMPVPLPQGHAAAPPQPQACYWINHTTGTVTPMRPEEMTASSMSHSTSVPSYTVAPPPPPAPAPAMPMSVPSASASVSSAPAFFMAPQGAYGGSIVPPFSASLSGTTTYAVPALLPLPPPPVKTLNGLQYQLGELYEGFVKRYNPNRGFGFLTATTHIAFCREDAGGAAESTPSGSATEMPATATVKEVRTAVHVGDIFVHQSYMHMQGFRTLPVGGRVRFRVGYKDGQQTFQAVEVELLPQVLPLNMEIPGFTTMASLANTGDANGAGTMMMLPATELLGGAAAPASQMPQTPSDAPSVVASIQSCGRAVNYTPSDDDGDDEEDQAVIELAFDMYSKFE